MRTELVTTLKRKATDLIDQISEDREPIMIAQHGLPAAFLIDVDTFSEMRKKITLLEGIARDEKAVQKGKALSNADARKRMKRWMD
jgi:prevent-host-death family protein